MNIYFYIYLILGILLILGGVVGFFFSFSTDIKKKNWGRISFIVSWAIAFCIFTLAVFMCHNCGWLPIRNIFSDYQYCYHCGEYLNLPMYVN